MSRQRGDTSCSAERFYCIGAIEYSFKQVSAKTPGLGSLEVQAAGSIRQFANAQPERCTRREVSAANPSRTYTYTSTTIIGPGYPVQVIAYQVRKM